LEKVKEKGEGAERKGRKDESGKSGNGRKGKVRCSGIAAHDGGSRRQNA
jgi:hypothetical protein